MPRVALSEFTAKKLIFQKLGREYNGLGIDLQSSKHVDAVKRLPTGKLFVAKVDQAVKRRNQSGLVRLKRDKRQIISDLKDFAKMGYRYAIVEPYVAHATRSEHYIALTRTDDQVELSYSEQGGVNIESSPELISRAHLSNNNIRKIAAKLNLSAIFLKTIYQLFEQAHLTLLEINPLVVRGKSYIPLDAAVEVDSAGQFFADGAWTPADLREAKVTVSRAEQAVKELKSKSPASFSLRILNPGGRIFLLLSGGGASVVIADELATQGVYNHIANYGEYSGSPSEHETYQYAKEIIGLLLSSKARKKILFIGGGVANFTDVAKTFAGIIRAMEENLIELQKQGVRIYVRRGGPNQRAGLSGIKNYLDKSRISNEVHGPDKSLADSVLLIAKAAR